MPRLPISLALLLVTGCALGRRPAGTLSLSSEGSDYSPAVRLAVSIVPSVGAPDSTAPFVVRVDSGAVHAPGELLPDSRPIMRSLRVSVLLAEFARERPAGPAGPSPPWREVARSAPQPLADSLRYGERVALSSMSFAIPAPRVDGAAANGIVFEITGRAVATPVQLEDETFLPVHDDPEGIRVYACSPFRLDGRTDRRRAKALRANYVSVC